MAFIPSLPSDKTDVPRRTDDGEKHLPIPDCGVDEFRVTHPGCRKCAKLGTHNLTKWINHKIPLESHRNSIVPVANEVRAQDLNKMQGGLFAAWAAYQNYITWYPSNVGGTANNMTQQVTYRVLSVSGSTVTLRGPNPKRLSVGNSKLNPDFVAPGLGEPRLIADDNVIALPAGACLKMNPPSVLSRLQPIIEKINPPATDTLDDVTFSVRVSCDMSNAMQPFDLAQRPRRYFCQVHFEANAPQRWGNFQEFPESKFTVTVAKHEGAAVHALKDSNGNDTRILYPDMENIVPWILDNGPFRAMVYKIDGTIQKIEGTDAKTRLTTTQSATGWVVTFDASDLTDVDYVLYTYCPEANSNDRYRRAFTSCCSNSQVDISESYEHKDGRLCGEITASQFERYESECWQPECDNFGLACKDGQYGVAPRTAVDKIDGKLLASFWTRTTWAERKILGSAAASAFTVFRPSGGGPGFGNLSGGYKNVTPVDLQEFSVSELQKPGLGVLVSWTDDDGNDWLHVAPGTFYRAPYDFTELDGPKNLFSGGTPATGLYDFNGGNPLGSSTYTQVDRMPTKSGAQYIGNTNVATSYAHGGQNTLGAHVVWTNVQSWVTGVDLSTVTDLNTAAQNYF